MTYPNFLNEKQKKLFDFVEHKHGDQSRKYTEEPYYNHLINVARLADMFGISFGVEVALCHDLFEDTECTPNELQDKLIEIGYYKTYAIMIVQWVYHITDHFTVEDYPHLNRKERKRLESKRLKMDCDYVSATIKCFDLIDNTSTIVKFDKSFAKVYLAEKQDVLNSLYYEADELAHMLAKRVLNDAKDELNEQLSKGDRA